MRVWVSGALRSRTTARHQAIGEQAFDEQEGQCGEHEKTPSRAAGAARIDARGQFLATRRDAQTETLEIGAELGFGERCDLGLRRVDVDRYRHARRLDADPRLVVASLRGRL